MTFDARSVRVMDEIAGERGVQQALLGVLCCVHLLVGLLHGPREPK